MLKMPYFVFQDLKNEFLGTAKCWEVSSLVLFADYVVVLAASSSDLQLTRSAAEYETVW